MTGAGRATHVAAVAALIASAFAAAILGFVGEATVRYALFERFGLAFVVAGLALLLVATLAHGWSRRRALWPSRDASIAVAVLLVATIAILLASPSQMRVQSDESLIAGTAFGIWTGVGAVVPIGYFRPDGFFEATTVMQDKRGLGVPVLYSILHFVRGYRFEHGFWVNHIAGWLALCATYALGRRWLAPSESLAAALFVAAFPMFAWASTSQTLEAVNLAALVGAAAAVVAATQRRSVGLACVGALLGAFAAQCRYESALAAALTFPVATWIASRHDAPRHVALLALVPWLYLPVAWQRAGPFEFDLGNAGAERAFGIDNLAANAQHAVRYFLTVSELNPSGPVVALLALAGLAAWIRRGRAGFGADARIVATFAGGFAAITVLVFAFAWGNVSRPETNRLAMPVVVALALAAASSPALFPAVRSTSRSIVLGAAGVCAVLGLRTLPADALNVKLAGSTLPHVHAEMHTAFPDCRFLWVTPSSPYFILRGDSAVTAAPLQYLWRDTRIDAERAGIDAIVGVQFYKTTSGQVFDEAHLPTTFVARELLRAQSGPLASYRVSLLTHPVEPLVTKPDSRCRLTQQP